ncbi:type II toxin-antitoxin system VapC family toxin [bacterium]|nr:type II toxin-antitoxin system VapC family toxin [bacterium]NCT19882.1 type II toxin-antitoxin system VapC family toxin [bacterium]
MTIDASVFISAFTPSEEEHETSKTFMRGVRDSNTPIIIPTLVIPEIAAAFGRGQGKPDLGYAYAIQVSQFPNSTLIVLDESLAETAANLAAHYHLRGSDAVYAAVATRFATELISLDREHLEHLKQVVSVRKP